MKDLMEKVLNLSFEELQDLIEGTKELLQDKSFNSKDKEILRALLHFLELGQSAEQYLRKWRTNLRGFLFNLKKLMDLERDMGADFREERIKKS